MKVSRYRTGIIAFASIVAMSACSSQPMNPYGNLTQPTAQSSLPASGRRTNEALSKGYLYVSNSGSDTIDLFDNGTYKQSGSITDSGTPAGLWLDSNQNLYVGNAFQSSVYEYAAGGSSPKCKYTDNLFGPLAVATDPKGNVEIANHGAGGRGGYIGEFKQCVNKMVRERILPAEAQGVAIDSAGDIFASYTNAEFNGGIVEFVRGSMTPKILGAAVSDAGGIALDAKNDIVVAIQGVNFGPGSIDVIAPPYKKVKVLVSKNVQPLALALNRASTLLFSANYVTNTVTVYSYPAGRLLKTIPVSGADGVVDSPPAQR